MGSYFLFGALITARGPDKNLVSWGVWQMLLRFLLTNKLIILYHKWPLTDLWLVNWIFEKLGKAKLNKQQMILLSLRSNPQTMSP